MQTPGAYLLSWHCKVDSFDPDTVPQELRSQIPVCRGFTETAVPTAAHTSRDAVVAQEACTTKGEAHHRFNVRAVLRAWMEHSIALLGTAGLMAGWIWQEAR